jgi:hypothetical protein
MSSSPRESRAARLTAFLKSGTGVVTAITTLVVAIAGLVTAVNHFGGNSDKSPSSPTATGGAGAALESDADTGLQSHIPTAIWSSCGPPVDAEEHAAAAFNCKYRRVVGLQYNLFASAQEMEESYADVKRRYKLEGRLIADSCGAGAFEGDYRSGGHLLCFVDDPSHVAAIVWTDRDVDILSFAWRDDMNLSALYQAWQQGLGPKA